MANPRVRREICGNSGAERINLSPRSGLGISHPQEDLMKKFVLASTLLALLFGLVGTTTAPASEDKEAFFSASIARENPNDKIFSISDDVGINFSQLGNWPDKLCSSTKDPKCNFKAVDNREENTISATPMLGLCEVAANDDCIESIEISNDATSFRNLTFERYMPDGFSSPLDGNTFPSDYS